VSPLPRSSALAKCFEQPDGAAWAVLADELGACGDPRGELIAVEQRIDQLGPGPEREVLEARRVQLYSTYGEHWAGPALADARARFEAKRATLSWTTRYGYLRSLSLDLCGEVDECEPLADLLGSEVARFLPRLSIRARPDAVSALVEALAREARGLVELELDLRAYGSHAPVMVGEAEAARLCHALPELRGLALVGRELFEDLPHPTLESLRVWGHDALVGLGQWTELPNLRELELALMSGSMEERLVSRGPNTARRAELLRAEGLTALRRLDLSRNAAGCHPHSVYLGGHSADPLFEELLDAPVLDRLDELILPSPPSFAAIEQMFAAPRLARVERVQLPLTFLPIDEATRQRSLPQLEVGLHYPHRPRAEIHGREVMSVRVGESAAHWVGYSTVAELMEARYAALSPELRHSLDELIEAFDELNYSDEDEGITHADLDFARFDSTFTALCEGIYAPGRRLEQLLEDLARHRGALDSVRVQKVWGW
jgi:hypothetical protein